MLFFYKKWYSFDIRGHHSACQSKGTTFKFVLYQRESLCHLLSIIRYSDKLKRGKSFWFYYYYLESQFFINRSVPSSVDIIGW